MRRRLGPPKHRFCDGFAEGFFFRVPDAFRPALDIHLVERVDRAATNQLREKMRAAGITDSKELLRYRISHRVWAQGTPALYSFRTSDTINTADDAYTIQVAAASPDTLSKERGHVDGEVSFDLYRRRRRAGFYDCTQSELLTLLRTGRCKRLKIDLDGNQYVDLTLP